MQLFKFRIASAILSVIVLTTLFYFTGCNTKTKQDTQSGSTVTPTTTDESLTIMGAPANKKKKIPFPNKPGRNRVAICIKANNINWNTYDSVVVEIYSNHSKSNNFTQFTFAKGTPDWTLTRFNAKNKFDLYIAMAWYQGGVVTYDPLCAVFPTDPNPPCVIPDNLKCTDNCTPVVTVQTTSGGGSTTTVNIEEQ